MLRNGSIYLTTDRARAIRDATIPYITDEIPSLWTLIKACYEEMTEPCPRSGKPVVVRPRMIWPRPRYRYDRRAGRVLYL